MTRDAIFLPVAHTWAQAVARWERAGTGKAERTRKDEARLLELLAERWRDLAVAQIDEAEISSLIDDRIAAGQGTRSINRMLEVVRAVLRSAARWQWIGAAPQVTLLPRAARRLRWLRPYEARVLLQELPPHLRAAAGFSLETGLRKRNVLGLEWGQVDLDQRLAWIHADQAKGRRSIPVPLSDTAKHIVSRQRGKHARWVFTFRGQPIKETNTRAWRNALQRAGIDRFRWHDLRHTWASWHAQAGTPMHVLQELGGWSTPSMVQVYAHLSTEHLRQHVDRLHARQRSLFDEPE